MVTRLLDYAELMRLKSQVNYLVVVAGAVLFGAGPLPPRLLALALAYVPFVVCLYGGIYAMNGVADRREDALHARKRHRPVAAGRITPGAAWAFAAGMMAAGVLLGHLLLGPAVSALFLGFIALNVFYTFVAKRMPYVELLANGGTYALRGVLGVTLGGGALPAYPLAALFLAIVGLAAARRRGEKEDGHGAARRTLRHYTRGGILTLYVMTSAGIAASWLLDGLRHPFAYLTLLTLHAVYTFGAERSRRLRYIAQI